MAKWQRRLAFARIRRDTGRRCAPAVESKTSSTVHPNTSTRVRRRRIPGGCSLPSASTWAIRSHRCGKMAERARSVRSESNVNATLSHGSWAPRPRSIHHHTSLRGNSRLPTSCRHLAAPFPERWSPVASLYVPSTLLRLQGTGSSHACFLRRLASNLGFAFQPSTGLVPEKDETCGPPRIRLPPRCVRSLPRKPQSSPRAPRR